MSETPERADLPQRVLDWAERARRDGLDEPLGRAIYGYNRLINGNSMSVAQTSIRTARIDTARRWREHWERGGSFQSINRTVVEQRALDKRNYARDQRRKWRDMTDAERLRKATRHARRHGALPEWLTEPGTNEEIDS